MVPIIEKVGSERIKEICLESGLTAEEVKIAEYILEKWDELPGQIDVKGRLTWEAIKDNPQAFLDAFGRILGEWSKDSAPPAAW